MDDTVHTKVLTDKLAEYSNREFDSPSVSVWGNVEGTAGSWENIDNGDILLFYHDEEYTYAAQVIGKEENIELSKQLWPDYDSERGPWKYIIYLDDPIEVNIPSNIIHEAAGHEHNFPQRFMTLNEQGHKELIKEYGSIADLLQADISVPSPEHRTGEVTVTEYSAQRKTRGGSQKLRKAALERYGEKCAVCDIQTPSLLQAPHIVSWADSNDEERGDVDNVFVMCYTHHKAFDDALFTIDKDFKIRKNPDVEFKSEFLRETITDRDGEEAEFLTDERPGKDYFEERNSGISWLED